MLLASLISDAPGQRAWGAVDKVQLKLRTAFAVASFLSDEMLDQHGIKCFGADGQNAIKQDLHLTSFISDAGFLWGVK